MDSEAGDLFLAKYGFFFADYCGRPSELLNINGPQLSVSTSRKGAPTGLSFSSSRGKAPGEGTEGLLTGTYSPPIPEDSPVDSPKAGEDAPDFIDIEEVKEAAPGESKPRSPPRGEGGNESPGKVVRVRRRLGNFEVAYYAKPKAPKLLEGAPGKAVPGGKQLARLQSARTVHRVGKVGAGAHLRPGWKMMYLLVVVSAAGMFTETRILIGNHRRS